MTEKETIRDFLSQRRVAIAGVSRKRRDFSRELFRAFRDRGFDTVPVNPEINEIEGERCFARVQEITPPVDGVLLMTSPAATEAVVRDCAAAGIKRVWMYRARGTGAVSAEAVRFCEANGIAVIAGECPMMFFPQTGIIHRLHGLVRQLTGNYPR